MLRIGVDVGGTNTDAALVRGDEVLGTCKALTTADVLTGVERSVRAALLASETGIFGPCLETSHPPPYVKLSPTCLGLEQPHHLNWKALPSAKCT